MCRQLSLLLFLALALLLCGAGVAMTAAGVACYRAETFLRDWAHKATEPDTRAWQVAEVAARRALAWYPVPNGDYLDRLGQIYSWRFYRQPYGSASQLATIMPAQVAAAIEVTRQRAQAAYGASVAVRPSWPYSWARLAHAHLYLMQFGAGFDEAYTRAAQLAPAQGPVSLELAEIGFVAWPSLSAEQREIALASALRAIAAGDAQAAAIEQMAGSSGLEAELCRRANPESAQHLQVCSAGRMDASGGG